MVRRVMKPHQLTRTAGGERLDARMHYTGLGDLSLSRLRYGATVRIEPGPLESFFLVQMPLCGTAAIESGGQRIDSSPELASVLSPECDTRMCWEAGNDRSCCASRARWSSARWSAIWAIRWTSRCISSWAFAGATAHPGAACCPIWSIATHYPDLEQHKLVLSQVEQLAASILLTSHLHNYSETAPARRSSILPRHVRRAQDYLQAHAHAAQRRAAGAGGRRQRAQPLQRFQGIPGRQPHALSARPAHGTRAHRAAERRGRQRRRRGAALGLRAYGPFQRLQGRYLETPSQTLRRH